MALGGGVLYFEIVDDIRQHGPEREGEREGKSQSHNTFTAIKGL